MPHFFKKSPIVTIYNDENGKVVRDEAMLSLKDYDVISEITRNHPVSDGQWKWLLAKSCLWHFPNGVRKYPTQPYCSQHHFLEETGSESAEQATGMALKWNKHLMNLKIIIIKNKNTEKRWEKTEQTEPCKQIQLNILLRNKGNNSWWGDNRCSPKKF